MIYWYAILCTIMNLTCTQRLGILSLTERQVACQEAFGYWVTRIKGEKYVDGEDVSMQFRLSFYKY
jgi:hypothetical protein